MTSATTLIEGSSRSRAKSVVSRPSGAARRPARARTSAPATTPGPPVTRSIAPAPSPRRRCTADPTVPNPSSPMRVSLIRAPILHGPFPAGRFALPCMKVLIVGCGRVGSALALRMTDDGHDVTVIDEDPEAHGGRPEDWPGRFLQGHGLDTDVLIDAGI